MNLHRPDALTLTLTTDVTSLARGRTATIHAIAEVRAGAAPTGERAPLTVIFVLDVSGSMSGRPLASVLDSTRRIAARLADTDRVGLVTFSSEAQVLLRPTALDAAGRGRLARALAPITPLGGTSIEAGLLAARGLLGAGRALVLVLTDGEANSGLADADGLATLVRRMRDRATVSTLGFGDHHDEVMLQALAGAGAGQYRFIADPALASGQFAAAVGAQLDVAAVGLRLHFTPAPGVRVLGALGAEAQDGVLELPDLAVGRTATAVLALEVSAPETGEALRLGVAELCHRSPAGAEAAPCVAALEVPLADDAGPLARAGHHAVLIARAQVAQAAARSAAASGALERALAEVERALAELEAAPGYVKNDGSPLAEAVEQLIDERDLLRSQPRPEELEAFRRAQAAIGSDLRAGARVFGTEAARRMADVAVPVGAFLIDLASRQIYDLTRPRLTLGRSSGADIVVPCGRASRTHAAISVVDGAFWIEDLGSSSPTRVNGAPARRQRLVAGDVLEIGSRAFRFEAGRGETS